MSKILKSLTLMSFFFLSLSCGERKQEIAVSDNLLSATNTLKENPTDHQKLQWANLIYESYMKANSIEEAINILQYSKEEAAKMGMFSFEYFFEMMADFHEVNEANRAQKLIEISTTKRRKGNELDAMLLYNIIITKYPGTKEADEAAAAAKNNIYSPAHKLAELYAAVSAESATEENNENNRRFSELAELFAMANPDDEHAGFYLFRAAEVMRGLDDMPKSLFLYNMVNNLFPDTGHGVTALFLQGWIHGNTLNDLEAARHYYTRFLEQYPEDHRADDVKFLLENLEKSNEEMLEGVLKKAEQKAQTDAKN
jgi:tetratricopeptide (TPR) repeat protein